MEPGNNLAPIALFAFNRPEHLSQTLAALKANEFASDSELFIFCDGPRVNKENELNLTQRVRELAHGVVGFKSVTVIESDKNKGLAKSIIDGVTKLCSEFGKVIVLEDDLVTSKYFLHYMNEGLEKYKNQDQVISIHGYIYPLKNPMSSPFFIKGADCWGWATWKRGWDQFNPDGQNLLSELERKKLTYRFDFNGTYPYSQMLKDQIDGINNSWAIRWYASALLLDKLTLYPNISLVHNIGLDNSGTHCGNEGTEDNKFCELRKPVSIFPDNITENEIALKEIEIFFQAKKPSFLRKFFSLFSRI